MITMWRRPGACRERTTGMRAGLGRASLLLAAALLPLPAAGRPAVTNPFAPDPAPAARNTGAVAKGKAAAKSKAAGTQRPLIGINMDVSGGRNDRGSVGFHLSGAYVDAITSAGGIPILLPAVENSVALRRYVELCDGFLFVGGGDISPERYGETSSPHVRLLHPRRENFDFALWKEVLKSRKPVLGVCLGCQQFNVARGGSLIQDLPTETSSTVDHRPESPRGGFAHEVQITTGTRLANLVGTTTLSVNSVHHQACETLGRGLRVTARAPDDIIEGIELPGHRFAVGIQWHPEALTAHPEHLRIYRGLVNAARQERGKAEQKKKSERKKDDKIRRKNTGRNTPGKPDRPEEAAPGMM